MIPPIADSSDPDPTSQMPWPAARGRSQQDPNAPANDGTPGATSSNGRHKRARTPPGKRNMTTWDLITLSVSMAGAQIAWTVELG